MSLKSQITNTKSQTNSKSQIPNIKRVLGIFFVICNLLFVISPPFVRGGAMRSTNYRMNFTDINSGGKEQTSATYRLDVSLGQSAAQRFSSAGYLVRSGFQYVHVLYPFRFTLSAISIPFGLLTPNTFSTQSLTATISHRGQGYEVKTIEEYPLRRQDLQTIPDTTCDSGCTETSAGVWTSTSAYGFGYNASGNDISSDFINSTYYRPFPSRASSESAATFMTSNQSVQNRTSTVTFKANISNIQPAGSYQTIVSFIAVPKY